MNKLIKEKRYQLLPLGLGTTLVIASVLYLLIRPIQGHLKLKAELISQVQDKIETAKRGAKLADQVKAELETTTEKLNAVEEVMTQGDPYRWVIKTLENYQKSYKIEFTDYEKPHLEEINLPPKVPYKTATFNVVGTATYHAFGNFLAAFENAFPHIRLRKLELEPAAAATIERDDENNLTFKMEFVALFKPPPAPP